ncbi:hypothetical protein PC119_g18589 [Phytophthora cactorum]|uniref:Uncharacterized protein n=1 Tax=Phytophthora cactorum TaxID=29920 RepID=A0A8T1C278_9STRA|nr:hypothetical protein PC114_g19229 [Phytophthora cactorum]KAG2913188.1 hypothetical protein PC117_g18645 [Phytophthora cactorum]KAG2992846.1 hypothetical protein PC119_g18589 [Phytophthora cactorum]KAG3012069.1 hypothetical protein PC120_g14072 [Phytophthora cactorum]KAG3141610.1 hypothetical protein C6341_g19680 [Phytophthora cactorum]
MHYVAVYGVFEADGVLRIQLFAVSPLQDGSQDADAHIKLFDGVLDVYNKKLEMVAFVIGDNCSTNQSIALSSEFLWLAALATGLTLRLAGISPSTSRC